MKRGIKAIAMALIIVMSASSINYAQFGRRGFNAVNLAQIAVRDRIIDQVGGNNPNLTFNRDAELTDRTTNQVTVRGSGTYSKSFRETGRYFIYKATIDQRDGDVNNIEYKFTDQDRDRDRDGDRDRGRDRGRDRDRDRDWDRDRKSVRFRGPIINKRSGKAIDVAGGDRHDGANVQQWSFHNQGNQIFEFISVSRDEYIIMNPNSRKVLDLEDTGIENNGGNVQIYRYHGGDNQRWKLEPAGNGYYYIISVANGRCLEVDGESYKDGANIQVWDCGNSDHRLWRLGR